MLYDIFNTRGEEISSKGLEFKDISGPVYLFAGGLFNLAGYENGDSLKKLLDNLSSAGSEKAQAFYIQEKTPTTWEDKLLQGYFFEKDGKVPDAAAELAHAVFLPPEIMQGLSQGLDTPAFEKALADLRSRFSRITLMGYSAGTAVIRQMEACIVGELEKAGLSDDQIKSVVQCGVVLDIGPAYSVPDTPKTLTHFVTVHRNDMMTGKMAEIMGAFPFPAQSEKEAVTSREKGDFLILTPEIGSPTVRSVCQETADPSSRRILFSIVEEAHSLFMYINVRQNLSFGGNEFSIYPSLPTATLAREFNAMALTAAAKAVHDGMPRNGPALLKSFQKVNMAPRRLKKLKKTFLRDESYFEHHVAAGKEPDFLGSMWKSPAFVEDLEKAPKIRPPNP